MRPIQYPHQHHVTPGANADVLFDRKIDLVTAGLQPYLNRALKDDTKVSPDNALAKDIVIGMVLVDL